MLVCEEAWLPVSITMAHMEPQERSASSPWLLLVFAIVVSVGVCRWAVSLLAPASTAHALAVGRPIGNNSDLYPLWLGARETLLHHRDPYSAQVMSEIQIGFYGRPLNASRQSDPRDQQAFSYPLYVIFLLSPTVKLPFADVMQFGQWFLLIATALSVLFWTHSLRIHRSWLLVFAAGLLSLSTYAVIEGLYQQQLTLLVAFLLSAAAVAAARRWFAVCGFLLAIATIKPHISGLFILWFLVWAVGDWKSRKALGWSFAGSMAALLIGAEILLPNWMPEFITAVQNYRHYAGDEPILQVLLSRVGGAAGSVLLLLFLIGLCWKWRKSEPGSHQFSAMLALAGTITLVILDKVAPYNQVLLIPALLWLLVQVKRTSVSFPGRVAIQATFACLIWQWVLPVLLSAWSLFRPMTQLKLIELPFYTVYALPPIALLAVLFSLRPMSPVLSG
jgi:hypothetical protein